MKTLMLTLLFTVPAFAGQCDMIVNSNEIAQIDGGKDVFSPQRVILLPSKVRKAIEKKGYKIVETEGSERAYKLKFETYCQEWGTSLLNPTKNYCQKETVSADFAHKYGRSVTTSGTTSTLIGSANTQKAALKAVKQMPKCEYQN